MIQPDLVYKKVVQLIKQKENICILGPAGSGKSHLARELLKNYEEIVPTASTGLAAVNIEGVTIHSLIGFNNVQTLRSQIAQGKTTSNLNRISFMGVQYILIDEVSMLSAEILDLIFYAEAIRNNARKYPIRFILMGDVAQLPPFDKYSNTQPFFEAEAFKLFKLIKLDTIHRQSDLDFINALTLVREGKAVEAIDYFFPTDKYHKEIDIDFRGPTVFATNESVNLFNNERMAQLSGYPIVYSTNITGEVPKDWVSNLPPFLSLKTGTKVMLLKNNRGHYANGDIGYITDLLTNGVVVTLYRDSTPHLIEYISLTYREKIEREKDKRKVFQDKGTIEFLPLRPAYATTIHKVQGMTCESLQFDIRHNFIQKLSGGLYTGLSRARNREGLRIIGTPNDFIRACKLDEKYVPYL